MNIYPVARIPDKWIAAAQSEGAHIDLSVKSPWRFLAAFDGSDPGGFVGVLLVGKRRAHIRGWYVFPGHRGEGVGGKLLTAARDLAVSENRMPRITTAHDVGWAGFVPTEAQPHSQLLTSHLPVV